MTCLDPDTGQRISVSWLFPRSAEDLNKKRRNSELWNELSWGQLGRSPDMLAPYIISALHLKDEFSAAKHPKCEFGENLENYYRYCKIHDLFLTHALGDPQVDRSQQPQNEQRMAGEDDEVALHVVEETKEGVIVSGGKQLSTAAPHSHEVYISLSATFARCSNPKCVLAFAIPTASPGLKILAREPISRWFGTWGHPLQMTGRAGLHAVFRSRPRAMGPPVHALRPDTDGEDARRRRRQRQFQLSRLGQFVPGGNPHAPDDGGGDDGRRGDRRHRIPRGRRQAGRDGDLLRNVASCHGGHRAPSPGRRQRGSGHWGRRAPPTSGSPR